MNLQPGDTINVFTGDQFASGPVQPAKITSVGLAPDGKSEPVSVNCTVQPEGGEPYELTSVLVHSTQPVDAGTQTGWLAK